VRLGSTAELAASNFGRVYRVAVRFFRPIEAKPAPTMGSTIRRDGGRDELDRHLGVPVISMPSEQHAI